jgi:hypothetical protein
MKTKHITIKLKREVVKVLPNYIENLATNITNNKYMDSIFAYLLFRIYEKFYHEMPYLKQENVFKFRLEESQVLFMAINKILPVMDPSSYEHNQLLQLSMKLDELLQDFNDRFRKIATCSHKNPDGSSAIIEGPELTMCKLCGETNL